MLKTRVKKITRRLNNWFHRHRVGDLTVYLFNVGQGDHVLLQLPNGEFGIIDFYYETSMWKNLPALIYLRHLKRREPDRRIVISFICVSHPDHDHIKGIDYFLKWVTENDIIVRHLWLFAGGDFSQLANRYYEACAQSSGTEAVLEEAAKVRDRLSGIKAFLKAWGGQPDYLQDIRQLSNKIGGVITAVLVTPLGVHVKKYDEQAWSDLFRLMLEGKRHEIAQRNLMSAAVFLLFRKHRLLFGGDTGEEIWQECISHYYQTGQERLFDDLKAQFVKVSHHGSRNSSSVDLWSRILTAEKSYLGISAGRRYGHPHSETVAHMQEAASQRNVDATIFSTNVCHACVSLPDIPEEPLEWLADEPSTLRIRPGRPTSRAVRFLPATSGNLAAYILRFSSKNGDVRLSKAIASAGTGQSACIYKEGRSGPFPNCAPAPM